MPFAFEYLIHHLDKESARRNKESKGNRPDLYEWDAAIFPALLNNYHGLTLSDAVSLRNKDDDESKKMLGLLRRRREPYYKATPAKLATWLLSEAHAAGFGTDAPAYLRATFDTDQPNPWEMVVLADDLMGLTCSKFFDGYLEQLKRDFPHDCDAYTLPLLRCYEDLRERASTPSAYQRTQRVEMVSLLIWVALVGPEGYRAFIDAGDPNARTIIVDTVESNQPVQPRIISVSFSSNALCDYHQEGAPLIFIPGDVVILTRELGFRHCDEHAFELGVGDGSRTFSRRSVRIKFTDEGALLTYPGTDDHAGKQRCLIVHFSGGLSTVRAGDPSVKLKPKDVIALSPMQQGNKLVPHVGPSGIMVDF